MSLAFASRPYPGTGRHVGRPPPRRLGQPAGPGRQRTVDHHPCCCRPARDRRPRRRGPVATNQPVDLTVALAQNDAALQAAYQAVYTSGSPSYHHFLSTSQVADQFGASPARWRAVHDWLTSGGLSVAYASPDRDLIEATGTAGAAEGLLGVHLDNYQVGAEQFVANTAAPTVPAALGITNILGLNTLERAVPDVSFNPARSPATSADSSASAARTSASRPPRISGAPTTNLLLTRDPAETLAMFGEGDTSGIASDLAAFEKSFGLPTIPVTLKQIGAGTVPTPRAGWSGTSTPRPKRHGSGRERDGHVLR